MIVIPLDPVLFQVGPIALRWYGLMYLVGILVGWRVASPYGAALGLSREHLSGALSWGFVGGIVGGRLYYVVQQLPAPYLAEPWRIVAAWEGGMAFFGAIFGALIALALFARRAGAPFWPLLDAGAIFATVGQAFGRLGNVVNGDVLGYPTDGSWGFVYTNPHTFAPATGVAYQPAPLYEIAANVAIFVILWRLRFRLGHPGLLFALYLALYAVSQFLVFFWRANDVIALGLKQAQWTAVVVLIGAGVLAWYRWRAPAVLGPSAAGHAAAT